MHVFLATITLTLVFMFWPAPGIPATTDMKRVQNAPQQVSGKKIGAAGTSRKKVRG